MNTTYYRLEIRRLRRDWATMFFTTVLPAFFYLIFGAAPDYGDKPVGEGNVAMWVMIAMAAYGAVGATTGIGGITAVERLQGWGRQLGLTPLTDRGFVVVKAAVALTIAAVPITLIFALGALTGAEAPLDVWAASAGLAIAGATGFSLYGLGVGLLFRSEAAMSAIGGSLVILAFLGNVFIPLDGWKLDVARFTPLYGYVELARRPLSGSGVLNINTGDVMFEPLWQPLLNVIVWTTIFGAVALLLVRRTRTRQ